jgi:hypothetical protein
MPFLLLLLPPAVDLEEITLIGWHEKWSLLCLLCTWMRLYENCTKMVFSIEFD